MTFYGSGPDDIVATGVMTVDDSKLIVGRDLYLNVLDFWNDLAEITVTISGRVYSTTHAPNYYIPMSGGTVARDPSGLLEIISIHARPILPGPGGGGWDPNEPFPPTTPETDASSPDPNEHLKPLYINLFSDGWDLRKGNWGIEGGSSSVVQVVPEPASILLLAGGLLGLTARRPKNEPRR